jgi:hypothetical protein
MSPIAARKCPNLYAMRTNVRILSFLAALVVNFVPRASAEEIIKAIGGRPDPVRTECQAAKAATVDHKGVTVANLTSSPMVARYCWINVAGFVGAQNTCQLQGLRRSRVIQPSVRVTILMDTVQPHTDGGLSAILLCFLCPPTQSSDACIASQTDRSEIDSSRFRDMGDNETQALEGPPPLSDADQASRVQAEIKARTQAQTFAKPQAQTRSCGFRTIDNFIHFHADDSIDKAIEIDSGYIRAMIDDELHNGCKFCGHEAAQTIKELAVLRNCAAGLKGYNYTWEYGAPGW